MRPARVGPPEQPGGPAPVLRGGAHAPLLRSEVGQSVAEAEEPPDMGDSRGSGDPAAVNPDLGGRDLVDPNVENHDVGNTALYLLSDLANGVTGEIHYVDAGYNKVGMPDPKNIT